MSIITRINKAEKRIVDLYNKLKNLPSGGGGVQTISGDFVDNTDPSNPVLNRGYKVYTALLHQSGADAPVATIMENTIGTITFTYQFPGQYNISSSGLFILGKTTVSVSQTNAGFNEPSAGVQVNSNNNMTLKSANAATQANNILSGTVLEIRVYN